MLKGIPPILSPELLKTMSEMGHGDELVIADGHFPAASTARRLIRADGLGAIELLDAILQFYPLDRYVERPVTLMQVVTGDPVTPSIWDEYRDTVHRHESGISFEYVERFAFYERAKQAFAVVATGETAQYANLILKKGLVTFR
ncbi:L-fucose mutarotase [Paenibacillus gansuensis]|uniref:L-fucose mutarotase n=1 Tax=Paenibacillus gansuensis TaxID=306542 RepID=A0ABW5PC27_9BACL